MSDKKISQLTGATTPLAGTEELPLVQSGVTKKVTVANTTAGRDVSMKNLTMIGGAADLTATLTPSANTYNIDIKLTNAAGGDSGLIRYFPNTAQMSFWTAAGQRWAINFNGTASELFAPIGVTASVGQKAVTSHQAGNAGQVGLTIEDGGGVSGVIVTNTHNGTFSSQEVELKTAQGGISSATTRLKANKAGDIEINTGNLIQGTAAKGINFTANTGAAGKTSQLLNWYEEGTFTPTGNGITFSSASGTYTRIGRQVTVTYDVTFPSTANTGQARVESLPYTPSSTGGGSIGYCEATSVTRTVNDTNAQLYFYNGSNGIATNANCSGCRIWGTHTYIV